MLINTFGSLWTGFGSAGPRSFYINGEAGAFFDFSTPVTLYTDAVGTVPLTAPGQTIGLACDKSRPRAPITAFAGVQASAGLRPTYARAPKSRRNTAVLSGNPGISGSLPWSSAQNFGVAAAVSAVLPPAGYGASAMTRFTIDGTTSVHGNVPQTTGFGTARVWSIIAKAEGAWKWLQLGNNTRIRSAYFNLETGTVGTVTGVGVTASIEPLGSGFYRCIIRFPALVAGFNTISMLFGAADNFGTNAIVGDGTSSFLVGAFQTEIGTVETPYQTATSVFDLTEAGYPAYGYARLDGADDKLTVTLPNAITGDLMLFGRNGSWIEAGVSLPSGAWELGPTGTILTPGVLHALGDLVGVVIIGRTTTTEEQALALRYFAARGAAGWLVAGAELVSNDGFDTDTIWTKGTGWTIAAGVATHVAGTGSDIEQASLLVLGQTYLVTLSVAAVRASSLLYVWDGVAYLEMASTLTVGSRQAVFVAKATGPLKVRLGAPADADIDNVSHKPLTVGA